MHWLDVLKTIGLWLGVSLILGELYYWVRELGGLPAIPASALLSSILAIAVIVRFCRRGDRKVFAVLGCRWFWWLLALSPALLAIFAAGISGLGYDETVAPSVYQFLISVLWVPLVEELVFRLGLTDLLRAKSPMLFAGYGSGIIFALMHTGFSWRHLVNLEFGLPLGPLLLAWASSWLLWKTNRICFCVIFHASCNGTVAIFQYLDPRWLSWLSMLYIEG